MNIMEWLGGLFLAIAIAAIVYDALSKYKQTWRANLAFVCAIVGGCLLLLGHILGAVNICPDCGEIGSTQFCLECGSQVKSGIICPECSAIWGFDVNCCGNCGVELRIDYME